ncbi:MAG: dihydropteroate synthase [Actinobacteria bacterium]|nr:dihydropteroate synthase [Actinomycetota bacterium]
MLIIGESLNGTIPSVGKAIATRDADFVTALALHQVECGAHMLDINAGGVSGQDESANLVWMVNLIQDAVSVPLVLDSSNPDVLRAAIAVYRGDRLILSSISAEQERIEALLPLAVEKQCGLVALCMSEEGIPPDAEGRAAVAGQLVERAMEAGLAPENLYIDPLAMSLATGDRAGEIVMDTLRRVRDRHPRVKTLGAISNVGFGVPQRRLLNRTFAAMLMALGLDAYLVDVRDAELMASLLAADAIAGHDDMCRSYVKAYRAGKLGPIANAKK